MVLTRLSECKSHWCYLIYSGGKAFPGASVCFRVNLTTLRRSQVVCKLPVVTILSIAPLI